MPGLRLAKPLPWVEAPACPDLGAVFDLPGAGRPPPGPDLTTAVSAPTPDSCVAFPGAGSGRSAFQATRASSTACHPESAAWRENRGRRGGSGCKEGVHRGAERSWKLREHHRGAPDEADGPGSTAECHGRRRIQGHAGTCRPLAPARQFHGARAQHLGRSGNPVPGGLQEVVQVRAPAIPGCVHIDHRGAPGDEARQEIHAPARRLENRQIVPRVGLTGQAKGGLEVAIPRGCPWPSPPRRADRRGWPASGGRPSRKA